MAAAQQDLIFRPKICHKFNTMNKRGFIYVASGEKYVREAAHSAARVRELHGLPITLICDQALSPASMAVFDDVRVSLHGFDYRDKLRMYESPYEHTIFVDTDTFFVRPVFELFDLLDQFDLALQFTEGGNHYRLPGVPVCFFEPSAGLIAWRKNNATAAFFDQWQIAYAKIEREQNIKGAWDHRSLRQALYTSNARFAPIPLEWQLYTYKPNFVCHETRMLHGRDASADMASIIDQRTGPRVWLPKIGLIPSLEDPSLPEYMRFALRFTIRFARRWGRLVMHRARIWRLPENQRPA